MTTININSINAVTRRRAEIIEDEGPAGLNPHTLEEWTERVKQALNAADRHACYGYKKESLKALVKALALGILCLDEHLTDGTPLRHPNREVDHSFMIIARYELYATLSLHKKEDISEEFLRMLDESDQKILDRYNTAKIKAICAEAGNFDRFPANFMAHKKADAAGSKPVSIGSKQ